jgi:hydrogenase nickel incorporation protein HypB
MTNPDTKHPMTPTAVQAELNREALADARVFTVSVLGGPACGKTALIDATIGRFMPDVHVGVISCNADRPTAHGGDRVVQVRTGGDGTLTAQRVHHGLASLDLYWLDLLFLENVGSRTAPPANDLRQNVTVLFLSVDPADAEATRRPDLVRRADVVLLNKVDRLGWVSFDLDAFCRDAARLHPGADVMEISALYGYGMGQWFDWLQRRITGWRVDASHWFG